ncbi:MAG TPA: S8/S53 family peptidase [Meiothermus sp.]|nr:S8/S53 family peptidase [Meiothermus sp.]
MQTAPYTLPAQIYTGTSFAAPSVAGALALWREAQPGAIPQQIEQAIKTRPRPFRELPPTEVGRGMLDLCGQP